MRSRIQLLALVLFGCGHHDSPTSQHPPEDARKAQSLSVPAAATAPPSLRIQKIEPGEPPASMVEVAAKHKFYIDRTEVTVEDYRECVDATVCTPPHVDKWKTWEAKRAVTLVKPSEAWDYCAYRGKRLPTRSEWIRAAIGEDGRKFPWGNAAPSCDLAVVLGCAKDIANVGSKPKGASPYGVLDMAGNVDEFVNIDTSGDRARFQPATLGGDGWSKADDLTKYFEVEPFSSGYPTDGETTGFRCALTPKS